MKSDWKKRFWTALVGREEEPKFTDTQFMLALCRLPVMEQRLAIGLRYVEGHTRKAAAETLGVTLGRFRTWEANGMRALRHPSIIAYLRKPE